MKLNLKFSTKNYRTHPRLFVAMAVIVVMFILADVLSAVNTDGFQDVFFYATLASVAIISSGVSVFQVCVSVFNIWISIHCNACTNFEECRLHLLPMSADTEGHVEQL